MVAQMQNPIPLSLSAWCPGGLARTKLGFPTCKTISTLFNQAFTARQTTSKLWGEICVDSKQPQPLAE
ncbi:MAG: hypothetical protein V7K41_13200 [Nostoc sp.]